MNTSVLKELLKLYEAQSLEQLALLVRPAPDDMLTSAELAVRLKMTVRSLTTWMEKGAVVPIRVEKTILFYWPSVVARLLAHYQQTPEDDGPGGKRKARTFPPSCGHLRRCPRVRFGPPSRPPRNARNDRRDAWNQATRKCG